MKTIDKVTVLSPKDKELLGQIKDTIRSMLSGAQVFLYGSSARGTRHDESDYDVLVLTDHTLTAREEEAVWDAVLDVELASGAIISTQFCSREEWDHHRAMPFYSEVSRDGIAL